MYHEPAVGKTGSKCLCLRQTVFILKVDDEIDEVIQTVDFVRIHKAAVPAPSTISLSRLHIADSIASRARGLIHMGLEFKRINVVAEAGKHEDKRCIAVCLLRKIELELERAILEITLVGILFDLNDIRDKALHARRFRRTGT